MQKRGLFLFFRWLSYIGINNNSKITTDLSEKIILSNRFAFVGFCYYVLYCIFFSVSNHWVIATTHFFVSLAILLCYYLNHKHHYYLSRTIFLLALSVGISAPDISFNYKVSTDLYFITVSLITYLIFEFSDLKFITVFSILPLCFWLIPRIFLDGFSSLYLSPAEETFFRYTNYIGAFVSSNLWAIIFVKTIIENNKKIMQLNKFSSLGEMSAGLSHEINNPLTVVLASCNAMANRLKNSDVKQIDQEEFSRYLDKSIFNGKRIARIVNGLRFFSRTSINDVKTEVKVSEIIRNTLDLCYENFANNQIKIEYPENSNTTLYCHAYEISQVFLNLLNNSKDAILNQNSPWIKIEIKEIMQPKAIQISVTDSGEGIDPFITDKIMTPFFTTKDIGKGTGLGLSISKGIIESHGGYLSLDSNSHNTRFVMDFPIKESRV